MKVSVTVKPRSKKGPLVEVLASNELVVYVRQPAADGQANHAVLKLLAEHFQTAKSNLKILRGHTARTKLIEVTLK